MNKSQGKDQVDLSQMALRFSKLRYHFQMSQVQFAKLLGCSQMTIWKYESGNGSISQQMMTTLRNRTRVNLNWLVSGEGEMIEDEYKTDCLDMLIKCKDEFQNIISAAYDRTDTLESYIELLQGENNEQ